MLLRTVRLQDFRSVVDSGPIRLGPVTLVVGRNNAGKSALLRGLCSVQSGNSPTSDDVRLGSEVTTVTLDLGPAAAKRFQETRTGLPTGEVALQYRAEFGINGSVNTGLNWNEGNAGQAGVGQFPSGRDRSLIVPVLARRKADGYDSTVSRSAGHEVLASDRGLTSRLAALSGGRHEEGRRFEQLARRILDLPIGTFLTSAGQQPGLPLSSEEGIPLDRMGEGVSSVLKILVELCSDHQRVYVVEEPETDLHPGALRELLLAMSEAVERGNQFVVSTHSEEVLRTLGALQGAEILHARLSDVEGALPTTQYTRIEGSFARRQVLEDLGYDLSDPMGWWLLEESTMEQFIAGYLIPEFAPKLAVLRTLSARGAGNIKRSVENLHTYVLYAHLSDPDRRLWTLADGDEAGQKAIHHLRDKFSEWPQDRFQTLESPDLESLYPSPFAEDVRQVRAIKDSFSRTGAKAELLQKVLTWARGNPDEARVEIANSASEVIQLMKGMEKVIDGLGLPY